MARGAGGGELRRQQRPQVTRAEGMRGEGRQGGLTPHLLTLPRLAVLALACAACSQLEWRTPGFARCTRPPSAAGGPCPRRFTSNRTHPFFRLQAQHFLAT